MRRLRWQPGMSLSTSPISRRRELAAGRSRPTTTSSRRNPTSSSPSRRSSSPASTRRRASGWTAGSRAAAASPATTGASSQLGHARHRARRQRRHQSLHRQLSVALLDRSARHARTASKPSLHAVEGAPWTTLLEKSALRGNGDNFFPIADRRPWTHLRLSIYPDGGVARLRVYGEVAVDWPRVAPRGRVVDLASITNGGLFLDASDMHYGTKGALIMPGRAKNMGDGWETQAPPRPRIRLGDRPARRAGYRVEDRDRHESLQGQLSRPRVARRLSRAGRDARARCTPRRGRRSCRRRSCRRTSATFFRQAAAAGRRRVARAAEHLSGRRRQPPAHPWHARTRLDDGAARRRARDADARVRIVALGRSHDGAPAIRQRREAADRGAQRVVRPDGSRTGSRRSRIIRRLAIAPRSRRAFRRRTICHRKSRPASARAGADVLTALAEGERRRTSIASDSSSSCVRRGRPRRRCWRCSASDCRTIARPNCASPPKSRRRSPLFDAKAS